MRMRSIWVLGVCSLPLLLSFSQPVQAENVYIVVGSSVYYDAGTNKVNGISQTSMDYRTTAYYRARAIGSIYTQDPNSPLTTSDIKGPPGQAVVNAYTQTTASPGILYNLRTAHYLQAPCFNFPGNPDGCSGTGFVAADVFTYYYASPSPNQFGASQTIYGCDPPPGYVYCYGDNVYDWIWMGSTNTSVLTPPTISITNPRVSGNLIGTTQNALIGADVTLTASGNPTGGTYSWTFTGSPNIVAGAANQPSLGVRWTQQGTFRGTVTYTKSGNTATYFVDVVVRLPALTRFDANLRSDQVNRGQGCSLLPGATYTLACLPVTSPGISWTSTSSIPAVAYLSNPAQSGIKFVQAVSTFRKRLKDGNTQCFTSRNSEANVASGWQLDTSDPYNDPSSGAPPRYFSEGSTLDMSDDDSPGEILEYGPLKYDVLLASDYFETYVVYFTGNPSQPTFQRALPFQGSNSLYSRLAWNWGGLVRFDYSANPQLYSIQNSTTNPGVILQTGTNSVQSMMTNAATLQYQTCAGTTATSNPIDASWYFVEQMYKDFLLREPDASGWNYWRSNITPCNFDLNCIGNKRVDVARAFFYSGEFVGSHPGLAGERGNHAYNSNFVWACYNGFLRREPNAYPDNGWAGFNFWVGVLDSTNPDAGDGKYNDVIRAFLQCDEYRNRFAGGTF